MDRATTSRRALLGTVAAIGAAAIAPAASASAAPAGAKTVSPNLLALIAEADRQDAEADRYEREVFDRAQKGKSSFDSDFQYEYEP